MILCRRGNDFVIRVGAHELMGSRSHTSEDQLALLGCAGLRARPGARVLIGGLGMGFTVRAALRSLTDDAEIDVVELVPAVVRWNRGPLATLAGSPLDDARVRVLEADVAVVIGNSAERYAAILLDVDNGPAAFTSPANARLYDLAGIGRVRRALVERGVFAVWSTSDDPAFTQRLERGGFEVRVERPPAHFGGGKRHAVWIARK